MQGELVDLDCDITKGLDSVMLYGRKLCSDIDFIYEKRVDVINE